MVAINPFHANILHDFWNSFCTRNDSVFLSIIDSIEYSSGNSLERLSKQVMPGCT